MDPRSTLPLLLAVLAACAGGKTETVEESDGGQQMTGAHGNGGSSSGSGGGSTSGGQPADAEPASDAPDLVAIDSPYPPSCVYRGGQATTGNPCTLFASEECTGDFGTLSFTVSCSCPDSTCSCTQEDPNANGTEAGAMITGVSYDGCPKCTDTSAALLFAACGFPVSH